MDYLADLKRWMALVKTLPKPVSYVVLDPSHVGPTKDAEDGLGRRYLQCSSGVLDEMNFTTEGAHGLSSLLSTPVYRLQDMRADWPGLGFDRPRP